MSSYTAAKTLRMAKAGERVRVIKVAGEGALRQRILDMGLTKGAEVVVRKVAPFGDPLELTVRGYELTLRKREAACIVVE
ncbi:MAG: ferrous iron transport protein A [Akkermansia sp.]|nr:ferrous iron transport protein A [Akkermansia sp.]